MKGSITLAAGEAKESSVQVKYNGFDCRDPVLRAKLSPHIVPLDIIFLIRSKCADILAG